MATLIGIHSDVVLKNDIDSIVLKKGTKGKVVQSYVDDGDFMISAATYMSYCYMQNKPCKSIFTHHEVQIGNDIFIIKNDDLIHARDYVS